ncbi:hypothetical protein A1OO_15630 [Enterovibrio norvegicus FF-33]|uniref:hypothetical protein n=1 Tax=Enterovibrio TaxID=188143 RepID=UPI0003080B10|nr:hypothetical protein [Enterovibrio norvegicus]OEE67186.1 hypothetical protein A1OO_15630 [Enterovibrio norvegicus FF-33]
MKKLALAIVVTATLSGCADKDLGQVVNDGVNGAINGVLGSVGGIGNGTVVKNDKGFSVEKETISIFDAERSSRDYGSITVTKTVKNPNSRTEIFVESCSQPRTGSLECNGNLFDVSPEGWLADDSIFIASEGTYQTITVAAGKYYFKVQSKETGTKYYATGEATIAPYKTNYISIVLE